jgi:hypothetical protein
MEKRFLEDDGRLKEKGKKAEAISRAPTPGPAWAESLHEHVQGALYRTSEARGCKPSGTVDRAGPDPGAECA